MSTFGKNYRQEVNDVNAGKVASPRGAVTASHQIKGSGARDINIHNSAADGEHARMAESLTKAAGQMAQAYGRKKRRDEWFAGYAEAGSEAGRKRVEEATPTWDEMIFGPGASKLGAQARMMHDDISTMKMELNAMNASGEGERMDNETYVAYVKERQDAFIDKYQDENFKDEAAVVFGKEAESLIRDQSKIHAAYTQTVARTALSNSVETTLQSGRVDMLSGDPDRAADAQERLDLVLQTGKAETTQSAWNSILEQQTKIDLDKGDLTLYTTIKNNGMFAEMDPEAQMRVEEMHDVRQTKYDRRTMEIYRDVQTLEESGDVEGVTRLVHELQRIDPEAVAMLGGLNDPILRASKQARINHGKAMKAAANLNRVAQGDTAGMTSNEVQTAADELFYTNAKELMMREARDAAHISGIPFDEATYQPTPQEMRSYMTHRPEAWIGRWGRVDAGIPGIQGTYQHLDTFMTDPDRATMPMEEVMATLDMLDMAQTVNGPYMYNGLTSDQKEAFGILRAQYRRPPGMGDADWAQMIQSKRLDAKEANDRDSRGVELPATNKMKEEAFSAAAVQAANEYGLSNPIYLDVDDQVRVVELLQKHGRDPQRAGAAFAAERLAQGRKVGNRIVKDGALIEQQLQGVGSLNRVIEGINNDKAQREEWIKRLHLAEDFDLKDPQFIIEPGPMKGYIRLGLPHHLTGSISWENYPLPKNEAELGPSDMSSLYNSTREAILNGASTVTELVMPGLKPHKDKKQN